jgi:hypothetical protein
MKAGSKPTGSVKNEGDSFHDGIAYEACFTGR